MELADAVRAAVPSCEVVASQSPTSPVLVVSPATYEFRFACQTDTGTYEFGVGPDVFDAAGTPMSSAYSGGFSIELPDLAVTQVVGPDLSEVDAGGRIEISWTVTNISTSDAVGSWMDRIYLSDDGVVGDDIEVSGLSPQLSTLAAGDSYQRLAFVTIPADLVGDYYLVVVTDADDDLVETGAEKIVMPRFPLLFRSHSSPRMDDLQGITNGPKNESQIARKPPPK